MNQLRGAMRSMGVRHATVENITQFLLDTALIPYRDVEGKLNSKDFLSTMASIIRGYTNKTPEKEVEVIKLDW